MLSWSFSHLQKIKTSGFSETWSFFPLWSIRVRSDWSENFRAKFAYCLIKDNVSRMLEKSGFLTQPTETPSSPKYDKKQVVCMCTTVLNNREDELHNHYSLVIEKFMAGIFIYKQNNLSISLLKMLFFRVHQIQHVF